MAAKKPRKSVWDVGNQHGFLCPTCKNGDALYITAEVTAALLPDGCDTSDSDTVWDEDSPAWCGCGCGWMGKVKDFVVVEVID